MKLNFAPTFKYFNQEKTILGKKINVDTTKELKDQDCLRVIYLVQQKKILLKKYGLLLELKSE